MPDGATYFAWFVMAFLFLVAVCLVVAIGSLPKKIAVKRNHPQVDAINAAAWVGLFLGGVGWIIAFVWAFLRSGEVGHDDDLPDGQSPSMLQNEIDQLRAKVSQLESQLNQQQAKEG